MKRTGYRAVLGAFLVLTFATLVHVSPAFALESVATFAADCTTPKTVFQLGDTVCAKVSSVAGGDLNNIWLQWVAPDDTVAFGTPGTTAVTTDPQTFLQALPTTGAAAQLGVWQARTANVSDSSPRVAANFRVPRVAVIGVRRASNATFYSRNTNTTGFAEGAIVLGNTTEDIGIWGDWTGIGTYTPGVYRPSDGTFHLSTVPGSGVADLVFQFGPVGGGSPLVGDWTGDGITKIGVHQADQFYLRNSNTAGPADVTFTYGLAGDQAVAGDWNGDGIDTIGVYRDGIVYLRNSNTTGFADLEFGYGVSGDTLIAGDWAGTGTTTIGVYRSNPGESAFYLRNSNDTGFADVVFAYGIPGDQPVVNRANQAPVVSASGSLSYTQGQAATVIDTTVTVTDMDSAVLSGATAQITGNCASGEDILSFTTQSGISGVYSAASCLMTLTGESSVANYQAALRTVKYNDSSGTPNTSARTVTWQVNDGAIANNLSNTPTSAVTVTAKQSQTITFTSAAPGAATVGGPTYNVTATATSGLAVTFTIDASAAAVCSIAGSTVSFTAVGTCVIDANQAGDATYDAAPQVQQSFAVGKGSQTISFTSSAPGGATVGGPTYTVTATATSSLAVTFTIDASATSVCSIAGSTVSFTAVGTCVIDANQAGDANYNAAPQVQQSFAVGKGSQTISFTSTAPSSATVGGPTYTVTATATSGLTVTFTIDAPASTVCSIAGSTVSFGPNGGTCVVDANQTGNANYNAAPQAQQSFTVTQAPAITSANSTTFAPGKTGQTFTVTTTGFPTNASMSITETGALPGGTTFTNNNNGTATIAGTPNAGTQGASPYALMITANNGVAPNATQNFAFNIVCPTIIVSGTIPALTYNVAMTAVTFTQSGGNGTITWSQTGLPTNLSLGTSSGQVSGTPNVTGTFNVTITATDAGGCTGSKNQSVTVAPVANGDTYNTGLVDNTQLVITGGTTASPSTPFVGKTAKLTDNDTPTGGVNATAGTFATSAGGSVTIAADGTFIYTPKVNSGGARTTSDSFTYTVTSNTGGGAAVTSAAATVNLALVGRVWYVLNNAGVNGNGQSQSPFNVLSSAISASTAGTTATDTDTIFVYAGDGTTNNLATASILKAKQNFTGQGTTLTVNGSTLVNAGSFPLIGNALTLANDVAVNGIDMSTAANSGLVGANTTGLSVTVRNLTTSTGTALNLSGPVTHPTGTVALSKVTTSGSGSGSVHISLSNVDAAVTVSDTTSSLSGAGTNVKAIDISGGTGSFTYPGTISNTGTGTNGGGISVASKTGSGTVTLSGATITLNTGGNTAFNMSGNSSGTTVNINPAGGGSGLDITTTSGTGFNATGGGTVSVQGASNTISSGTGTALNVSSATIGASGLTFLSISSNGATSGIVLNGTGASGGLTVTGDGASDPNNTTRGNTTAKSGGGTITTGSGGTIQNTTGSGLLLTNTGAVHLTSMNILNAGGASVNTGNEGLRATNVNGLTLDNIKITGSTGNSGLRGYSSAGVASITNLTMQHVEISGNGTASGTEANDNWNVRLDDIAGNCGDATNGCGWNNSLFFSSRENVVGLKQGLNFTTVTTTMTITNSEFRDTTTFANPANDAFGISAFNSAVTNVTATGSTFKNVEVTGFQYSGNDSSSGTVNVRNSIFENTGTDINIAHQGGNSPGATTLNFDISGNTERQQTGNPASSVAINIFLAGHSNAGSSMIGTIKNNTIGNAAVSGSGSHVGDGIDVNATGAGTITATVTGNTVHQIHQGDVFFAESNSGSAHLNLNLHSNSFNSDQSSSGAAGANLVGGAQASDTATLCVDMGANTLHGDTTYFGITLQAFSASSGAIELVGMSTTFNDNTSAISNFVGSSGATTPPGVNTSVTPAPFVLIAAGSHVIGAANCNVAFPP